MVPAIVAAGRAAVRMILRRLLISMVAGIGLMVGMDVAVQTFQMMLGDRTRWNAQNTLGMLKAGAIGGAIGGALPMVAGKVVPKFADLLVGKLAVGGVTGLVTTVAQDVLLGGSSALAGAFTSGAAEAFSGGGRRFRWQKPQGRDVNSLDVKLPDLPDLDLSQLESDALPLLWDPPGGGGRPGGGGQLTESDGPPGTVSAPSGGPPAPASTTGTTGTGGGASGTQQTGGGAGTGAGGGRGAVPAPVSGADTPSAPGADRSTGNRQGDGKDGTDRTERQTDRTERRQDRTERQQDGRDGRFARGAVPAQPGGTVTLPPGTPAPPRTPADEVPGTALARPARGLPGFGTILRGPGSGEGTAPGTDSGPGPGVGQQPGSGTGQGPGSGGGPDRCREGGAGQSAGARGAVRAGRGRSAGVVDGGGEHHQPAQPVPADDQ